MLSRFKVVDWPTKASLTYDAMIRFLTNVTEILRVDKVVRVRVSPYQELYSLIEALDLMSLTNVGGRLLILIEGTDEKLYCQTESKPFESKWREIRRFYSEVHNLKAR
jgi:hypothetical protein